MLFAKISEIARFFGQICKSVPFEGSENHRGLKIVLNVYHLRDRLFKSFKISSPVPELLKIEREWAKTVKRGKNEQKTPIEMFKSRNLHYNSHLRISKDGEDKMTSFKLKFSSWDYANREICDSPQRLRQHFCKKVPFDGFENTRDFNPV